MKTDAVISDCGVYRYHLSRVWDPDRPNMLFVMLNPSTADAEADDPTINRCISFAKREQCGGVEVVNLFAFRSPYPKDLRTTLDPNGPENGKVLRRKILTHDGPVVAAWGNERFAQETGKHVTEIFGDYMLCLGHNKNGSPKHPLYLAGDTALIEFTDPVEDVI